MTSFRNLIAITFLLLACCSCQSRKESITQIQEQLRKDSLTLCELQRQYPDHLRENFFWCDSMLRFLPKKDINEYFDVLNLAQAYLHQFEQMLPVMWHDLSYIRTQTERLQNDIDTHYLNDSLATVYLHDEVAAADTLHNRILYFQDRLSKQDQALEGLRKTIHKATSK